MRKSALIFAVLMMGAAGSLFAQSGQPAQSAAGQAAVDAYNNRHANVAPNDILRWLVHRTLPVYPPDARAAHIGGNVVVAVEIDKEGKVISAQAVDGPELLRAAAVDCAKQWTFRPYVIDGNPVYVETTLTVGFVSL